MEKFLEDIIMITLDNLGEFKKGRLWINTSPNIQCKTNNTLKINIETNNVAKIKITNIALEVLLIPRHISNYALLGAKFTPGIGKALQIQVDISQYDGEITKDSIAMPEDEVHVGIPEEYSQTIIETAQKVIKERGGLPSGVLEFYVGAHGYVGSSKQIFSKITSVILKLMTINLDAGLVEEIKKQATLEIMQM